MITYKEVYCLAIWIMRVKSLFSYTDQDIYRFLQWGLYRTLDLTMYSDSVIYWLAIKTLTAMDSYNEVSGTVGGGTGQYPAVWDLGQYL